MICLKPLIYLEHIYIYKQVVFLKPTPRRLQGHFPQAPCHVFGQIDHLIAAGCIMEMNSPRCGMGLPNIVALTPFWWQFQRKQKWLTVIFWGRCFHMLGLVDPIGRILCLTRQSHQVKQHPHIYPCLSLALGSQNLCKCSDWLQYLPFICASFRLSDYCRSVT